MKKELAKNYDQSQETQTYQLWEEAGAFTPTDGTTGESFSIIMPPANSNGNLHAGHMMFITLEDIMTRYHRMKGDKTLWLPGTDHAGFETQYVFEKVLAKEGNSRFKMSRDEFYKRTYDFTIENQKNIISQLKRAGASADWSRAKFTLDDDIIKLVYSTFEKLFKDGLIYRAKRLVNYSFKYASSLSDLEVDYIEQPGKLWYLKYPIKDSNSFIQVATTRPETMLGDTAIAVHPDDKRYKDLVGKTVVVPLVNREIPIVADDVVEIEFGTGAVKITPAHDQTDFEIGERHNLPLIQVIGFDGKMMDVPEKYLGMKTDEARGAIVADLEAGGYLEKTEDMVHRVAVDYKSKAIIEPLPMAQWFVKMRGLADEAIKAVKAKKVEIIPDNYTKVLLHWLENIRDWNISRQIWWGISIPAWYDLEADQDNLLVRIQDKAGEWKTLTGRDYLTNKADYQENTLQLARALESASPIITNGEAPTGKVYLQEPDTFDTWFSSGQWPFVTLGFDVAHPEKASADFKTFYPTTVMETGADILFFWVARMIMLGLYNTGDVPFRYVYLHGLVNDEHGKKMSKSKGNVVNPLDLMDKYGADALRLALIIGNTPGAPQALDENKVRGYRNFANKLWNVARFVLMSLRGDESGEVTSGDLDATGKEVYEEWTALKREATELIEKFRFDLVADKLYHFAWHTLADKYLEYSKDKLDDKANRELLLVVLKELLITLHPFVPFVTEAIWQEAELGGLLINEPWTK